MQELKGQEFISLRDAIFNQLRQDIITGDLKPGERLREIKLAEKMGASRTPIREAIRRLEMEGLVVMVPRHGATVAGITRKQLMDVLEIRRALEELAIELACSRMTVAQLNELKELERDIKEQKDSTDSLALSDIDEKFHEKIYQATNNPRLIQMLAELREQMYRYRLEYMKAMDKRNKLVTEHNRILKAIETGDVEMGKNAIRVHINSQEEEILAKIDQLG